MDSLIIKPTNKIPFTKFDSSTGILEITGCLIPENPLAYSQQIFDWIDNYKNKPNTTTTLILNLEYFNTSSVAVILKPLFSKLELLATGHYQVEVKWYYDDTDTKDIATDFSNMFNIPFNLIEIT